jgi:endonuclease/exonuclease/phosphatase family metal-dependent hydrolase
MKLISLNTWGGRALPELLDFLRKNRDTDIFCLQEIYHEADPKIVDKEWLEDSLNLYNDITATLPHHMGYFRPSISNWYGLAMFVRKDLVIAEEGDVWVYEVPAYVSGGNHPRNLQYIRFAHESREYLVANVHGLWNGMGKTDSEHRLEQSQRIKKFLDSFAGPKMVCGDFNLLPETESVRILEEGMRNLIREHNIASTRTHLYPKPGKHADYIFVSPDVTVKRFEVLPDVVSDHAPLLLEF